MQAFGPAEGDDARMKALNFILAGVGGRDGQRHSAGADGLCRPLHGAHRSRGVVRRGLGRFARDWPGAARAERRVHALPHAPVAARAPPPERRLPVHQKRRRLTIISPIRTQPKPISTRPAMRVDLPKPHHVQAVADGGDELRHDEPIEEAAAHDGGDHREGVDVGFHFHEGADAAEDGDQPEQRPGVGDGQNERLRDVPDIIPQRRLLGRAPRWRLPSASDRA